MAAKCHMAQRETLEKAQGIEANSEKQSGLTHTLLMTYKRLCASGGDSEEEECRTHERKSILPVSLHGLR